MSVDEPLVIPNEPKELSFAKVYLTRSREFINRDDTVAFYAICYVLELAIARKTSQINQENRSFIETLLKIAETLKQRNKGNELFTNNELALNYIRNIGMKAFTLAEKEEHARKVSKATVTKFLAAISFFDICKQFGSLPDTIESRLKYAKLHAARLGKAFQEGEDPVSVLDALDASSKAYSEQKNDSDIVSSLTSDDISLIDDAVDKDDKSRTDKSDNPEMDADTTGLIDLDFPGSDLLAKSKKGENECFHDAKNNFDPNLPKLDATNSEDGAVQSTAQPSQQEEKEEKEEKEKIVSTTPPQKATIHPVQPSQKQTQRDTPLPQSRPPKDVSPPPPPQPSSNTSSRSSRTPSLGSHTPGSSATTAAVAAAVAATNPEVVYKETVNFATITEAQKHARWAISALNYEDTVTAIKELQISLKLLTNSS